MKHFVAIGIGALFGFFVGLLIFIGPLSHGSFLAHIWSLEEKPMHWMDSILTSAFGMASGRADVWYLLLHFIIWTSLGGLVFWLAAILASRLSNNV